MQRARAAIKPLVANTTSCKRPKGAVRRGSLQERGCFAPSAAVVQWTASCSLKCYRWLHLTVGRRQTVRGTALRGTTRASSMAVKISRYDRLSRSMLRSLRPATHDQWLMAGQPRRTRCNAVNQNKEPSNVHSAPIDRAYYPSISRRATRHPHPSPTSSRSVLRCCSGPTQTRRS